jgi:hypothetical protein
MILDKNGKRWFLTSETSIRHISIALIYISVYLNDSILIQRSYTGKAIMFTCSLVQLPIDLSLFPMAIKGTVLFS